MSRPGTVITYRDAAPARGAATDTGTWFVAGLADRGPTEPVLIQSLEAFRRVFGERVSYSVLSDAIETFFAEGGARVYVSRVVGSAAAKASATLNDSGGAPAIRVEAVGPGDWYNALNVEVVASGGSYQLVISHDTEGELERSPSLADNAAAVAWAENSDYVRVVALGVNDPATVASTGLAGGSDDRANITDAHWRAALDRFDRDLGPGQVSAPGRVEAHADLLAHAAERNRRALLDVAQSDVSKTALISRASALRPSERAEFGALFAPWATTPGLVPGTTRDVPYSAVQAGLIAASDARTDNPNIAAAGDNGVARFVVSLKADGFSEADRRELNEAGVCLARTVNGQVKTYGYRTLVDPLKRPLHWQFANSRLDMAIAAEAEAIAERFVFRMIDGKGHTISQFGGELSAMLKRYYALGALFGATAEDAFRVDVGPSVNTVESIAEGRLRAVLAIRRSPFAELVEVEIVRSAVDQAV